MKKKDVSSISGESENISNETGPDPELLFKESGREVSKRPPSDGATVIQTF